MHDHHEPRACSNVAHSSRGDGPPSGRRDAPPHVRDRLGVSHPGRTGRRAADPFPLARHHLPGTARARDPGYLGTRWLAGGPSLVRPHLPVARPSGLVLGRDSRHPNRELAVDGGRIRRGSTAHAVDQPIGDRGLPVHANDPADREPLGGNRMDGNCPDPACDLSRAAARGGDHRPALRPAAHATRDR